MLSAVPPRVFSVSVDWAVSENVEDIRSGLGTPVIVRANYKVNVRFFLLKLTHFVPMSRDVLYYQTHLGSDERDFLQTFCLDLMECTCFWSQRSGFKSWLVRCYQIQVHICVKQIILAYDLVMPIVIPSDWE